LFLGAISVLALRDISETSADNRSRFFSPLVSAICHYC